MVIDKYKIIGELFSLTFHTQKYAEEEILSFMDEQINFTENPKDKEFFLAYKKYVQKCLNEKQKK